MKNLDDVFMEAFVKTAAAKLEELETPAEVSDTDKLVAKIQEWRGERAESDTEKVAGMFSKMKADYKTGRAGYKPGAGTKHNLASRIGKNPKASAAIGAAGAAAAGYGIHKGIQAFKNRKKK